MIIITIAPKQSRLATWLIMKSLPGISFWLTDPCQLNVSQAPTTLLEGPQIAEPSNLKSTYEFKIVVNPPDAEKP